MKWVDKSQPDYWSGTEFDSDVAWRFHFGFGSVFGDLKVGQQSAWAVRPGE